MVFVLLTGSCAPSPEEPEPSFPNPVRTQLTFINDAEAPLAFGVWPAYTLVGLGSNLPDSLAAGDSLSVRMDLPGPRRIIVATGSRSMGYDLLPGKDRRVRLTAAGHRNRGLHRAAYDLLDRGEAWVPTTIGPEWTALAYDDFLDSMRRLGAAADDTVRALSGDPDIRNLLAANLRLRALKHQAGYASFRSFFYHEKNEVPRWLADSAYHALDAHPYGTTAEHKDLYQALIVAETLASMDSTAEKLSAGTRNYTAFMERFLALPNSDRGHTARAELVMEMIGTNRDFTDRQLIQDSLLAALPPAYRRRVLRYADAFARTQGSAGLQSLFASMLPEERADSLRLREARETDLTLYKFWFAGCVPCIRQYPAERELLDRYPDLRMHTIAFSTKPDNWRAYLEGRRPPGSRHFFVSDADRPLLKSAVGDIGAPYYVLTRADSVVCRSCPKPSDPLIREYLTPSPAGG